MWIVAGAAALLALAAVVAAIVGDAPGGPARRPAGGLPEPGELRRTRFPTAWRGYDRAHVDAFLAATADALEVLLDEVPPEAAERARRRLSGSEPPGSGQELEDGGGDRPGVLDR